MKGLAAIALCIGLVAGSMGCGGDDEQTATSGGAADLHVVQVWDESGGLYVEGALSYVAIETPDGEELLERELQPTATGAETTIRLDPGDYRLVSWQRPSAGGGDVYDPPTDRCDERFKLASETPLRASIEVRAGSGCTITFE